MKKVLLPPFDCSELPNIKPDSLLAGVDEVGKGALFGPVVAACVVFCVSDLPTLTLYADKDSKQLSAKKRTQLAKVIKDLAVDWKIGYAKVEEIDRLNIFHACLLAMKKSVTKLKTKPSLCLVDGKHKIPNLEIQQINLIKGDRSSPLIAAASIIAKVWRDELIQRWSTKYVDYDLLANKGYGTSKHLLALSKYGPSPQHRLSFSPCRVSLTTNDP